MTLTIKPSRRSSEQKQLALEEAVREDTTRLNILIPESLHRELRLRAASEGKGATITGLIIRSARELLENLADEDINR